MKKKDKKAFQTFYVADFGFRNKIYKIEITPEGIITIPICHQSATIINRIKQKAQNLIKKINIKKTFNFKYLK